MSRTLAPLRFRLSVPRALALFLLLAAPSAELCAHSILIVNDVRSPGVLGDARLSLHEAILVATDRLQLWELSPGEAAQVIQDPGRFQVDTLIFDASVFPASIVLEAPLPLLDDPIGDYVDATNFHQFPLGAVHIDGSRLPAGTPIFDVEGSNTGIHGWHLTGARGDAIRVSPSTLLPRMHGLLFQANLIEGALGAGIAIRTGARTGISWDVQILENAIRTCAGGGVVFEAQSGTLQDAHITIESNLFDANGHPSSPQGRPLHGVALIGATNGNDFLGDFEVRRNFVRASAGCGFLIDGAGPGSTWGGVFEANASQANGYGILLQGASLPGSGQNDVSASVRGHASWRDVHGAIFAVAGAAPGTSGAFVSLSLFDVSIADGCDVAQVLAGAGSGDANTVSLSLREVALLRSSGDGLRVQVTAADALHSQDVQVRATALEVQGATRDGIALLGGAGRGGRLRFQGQAVHVEACGRGLSFHGSDGSAALRDHDLELTLGDLRLVRSRARGCELEGRGGRLALRLRTSIVEASQDAGLHAADAALGTTTWDLDLGSPVAWGLNSFLDHRLAAIELESSVPSATARGNWWGSSSGAPASSAPNGVSSSVDAAAPLARPFRLRLAVERVISSQSQTLTIAVPDPTVLTIVFLGTQTLDLSSQGGGLWIDPQHPASAPLVAGPGGSQWILPIPADPALSGVHFLCQAFAPAEGLASAVRCHWIL